MDADEMEAIFMGGCASVVVGGVIGAGLGAHFGGALGAVAGVIAGPFVAGAIIFGALIAKDLYIDKPSREREAKELLDRMLKRDK